MKTNTRTTTPGFFFLSRNTKPLFQVAPGIDARTALENAQTILDAAMSAIRPVARDIEPIEQCGIWSGLYGLEQVAALLEQAANSLDTARPDVERLNVTLNPEAADALDKLAIRVGGLKYRNNVASSLILDRLDETTEGQEVAA